MCTDINTIAVSGARTVGSSTAPSAMGILKNPIIIPQQVVLNASWTDANTKTSCYLPDAVGTGVAFGLVNTATGIAFTIGGGITPAILGEFLKTYAIIVGGYNFEVSTPTLLTNNLVAKYASLDGNSTSKQMFSNQSVSNMQQNPNLLNVEQSFVWTNSTSLVLPFSQSGLGSISLTMKIAGVVAYGDLDTFLAEAQIPERSRLAC
jgi:hypothetical protein